MSVMSLKTSRMSLLFSGALATAGVLVAGLVAFKRGNTNLSQQLMRTRVLFQGATVAFMVGSVYIGGAAIQK